MMACCARAVRMSSVGEGMAFDFRRPELVSGPFSPHGDMVLITGWMLKHVQHDDNFV